MFTWSGPTLYSCGVIAVADERPPDSAIAISATVRAPSEENPTVSAAAVISEHDQLLPTRGDPRGSGGPRCSVAFIVVGSPRLTRMNSVVVRAASPCSGRTGVAS